MNKLLLSLLMAFSIHSCHTVTDYDKLSEYLSKKNKKIDLANLNTIIVVNDNGGCLFCSSHFTKTVSRHIADENLFFIVASNGSQIDISSFISAPRENVIVDFDKDFSKLNLVNGCAIIKMGTSKIDTIIEIQSKNLQTSLSSLF